MENKNLCLVEGDTKTGSRRWQAELRGRVASLPGTGKSGRPLSRAGK